MDGYVEHANVMKRIVMHVQGISSKISIHYTHDVFRMFALESMSNSYIEVVLPQSFFTAYRVKRNGGISIDAVHMYMLFKSCVSVIHNVRINIQVDRVHFTCLQNTVKQHRYSLLGQNMTRIDALSNTVAGACITLRSSPSAIHEALSRLRDIVTHVHLRVLYAVPCNALELYSSNHDMEATCTIPAYIVCEDCNHAPAIADASPPPSPSPSPSHRNIGRYCIDTLCNYMYFCTMSMSNQVYLQRSCNRPLKLYFHGPHGMHATMIINPHGGNDESGAV